MAAGRIVSIFLILTVALDLATNQAAAQTTDAVTNDPTNNPVTSVSLEEVPVVFTSPSETFSTDLLDSTTAAYQARETAIKNNIEPLYQAAYSSFSSLAVTGFSSGSVINSIVLKFESGSVPSNSEISTTLTDGASGITDIEIDTSSISVGTTPATTATPITTRVTTPTTSTTQTPATTPIISTLPVTTTPETDEVVSRDMSWSSPTDIFTPDLLDSTSQGYQDRANLIKDQIEPVYKNQYDSFNELEVLGFRSGSVINDIRLTFKNTSVPDTTEVAATLVSAASNITGIEIDTSTITVTMSSAGQIHGSLLTACFLALFSWLLTREQ